jgi:peptidoglycan/xylan/chitin deacetylase (PgdA/CDA1 family)
MRVTLAAAAALGIGGNLAWRVVPWIDPLVRIRWRLPPAADGRPRCAVTFDDGPSPGTAEILDALRAASVRATFFVVARNAARYPQLVRRAAAEGHAIGIHGTTHRTLTFASAADAERASGAFGQEHVAGVEHTLLAAADLDLDATTREQFGPDLVAHQIAGRREVAPAAEAADVLRLARPDGKGGTGRGMCRARRSRTAGRIHCILTGEASSLLSMVILPEPPEGVVAQLRILELAAVDDRLEPRQPRSRRILGEEQPQVLGEVDELGVPSGLAPLPPRGEPSSGPDSPLPTPGVDCHGNPGRDEHCRDTRTASRRGRRRRPMGQEARGEGRSRGCELGVRPG